MFYRIILPFTFHECSRVIVAFSSFGRYKRGSITTIMIVKVIIIMISFVEIGRFAYLCACVCYFGFFSTYTCQWSTNGSDCSILIQLIYLLVSTSILHIIYFRWIAYDAFIIYNPWYHCINNPAGATTLAPVVFRFYVSCFTIIIYYIIYNTATVLPIHCLTYINI